MFVTHFVMTLPIFSGEGGSVVFWDPVHVDDDNLFFLVFLKLNVFLKLLKMDPNFRNVLESLFVFINL